MAFLLPALGSVLGNILPKIFGGSGIYTCKTCNAPMIGGKISIHDDGSMKHRVRCVNCGHKEIVNHDPETTQNVFEYIIDVSPEGGYQDALETADTIGTGIGSFFGSLISKVGPLIKQGIKTVAPKIISAVSDKVRSKAPELVGKLAEKAGEKIAQKISPKAGESVKAAINDLGAAAVSKVDTLADLAKAKVEGSGIEPPSFGTIMGAGLEGDGFMLPGTSSKGKFHTWKQNRTAVTQNPTVGKTPTPSVLPTPTQKGSGHKSNGWVEFMRTQKGKGLSTKEISALYKTQKAGAGLHI